MGMDKNSLANQKRDIRWLKKQEAASEQLQNCRVLRMNLKYSETLQMEKILKKGDFTEWEAKFLRSVMRYRNLSDKQREVWNKIKKKNTSILE